MHNGYVKLYRRLFEKGWSRKPEYVALWVYCLSRANHKPTEVFLDGKPKPLQAGQFVTSRLQICTNTGIERNKVERILKCFESEQQIEQQTFTKYRIISIVNWQQYQESEQQIEQKVSSKRAASEQQVSTDKNDKNDKNDKKKTLNPSASDDTGEGGNGKFYQSAKNKKLTGKVLERFEIFWEAFDYKTDKAKAADAWISAKIFTDATFDKVIEGAKKTAAERSKLISSGKTPIYAQGWLTGRRWEDEEQNVASSLLDEVISNATGNDKTHIGEHSV